jgi:small subunit ribosomal protein S2
MRPYIFGERNGIYIIDLQKTLEATRIAYEFVRDRVADGGSVLFVGTKKQAQDPVGTEASRVHMPYVNFRWLGGMLTNFTTMRQRILYMTELQRMDQSGEMSLLPKKEALHLRRELDKLERNLGGISNMDRVPDAVFVIDTKKEQIAVTEANKLHIPVVAVVDTNCDPDLIDFVIPGNDDAIRAGALMSRIIADACEEGKLMAAARRGHTPSSTPAALEAEIMAAVDAPADAPDPAPAAGPVDAPDDAPSDTPVEAPTAPETAPTEEAQ